MNVMLATKNYITKMIDNSGPGMKALLMDSETISIVSMVFSQSEILQKEVYLFESIESMGSEIVQQVKALVFVRPTNTNIQILSDELKRPRFSKYYLYFSNTITKSDVKILAESDEHECVCDINEYFADFYPLDRYHFTLNIPTSCYNQTWRQQNLTRSTHGVISAILAINKRPTIRYHVTSDSCKRLAESINHVINREASLFSSLTSSTLLLILDRRDDVITPLLNQWTYEAMTHELFGIKNGRVTSLLREEFVLSTMNDEFYRENLMRNFGEIGLAIKQLMESFQAKSAKMKPRAVESIDDMKNFVENYPQFNKMSGTVAKHVTLVSEMSKLVAKHNLLEISELEQDLVTHSDHNDVIQRLRTLFRHPKMTSYEAFRLAALYALRYPQSRDDFVEKSNYANARVIVDALKRYDSSRSAVTSQQRDLRHAAKRLFTQLNGVENVYTQHKPKLKWILDKLAEDKLRSVDYPSVGMATSSRPNDVIVFMIGGTTYEEIACVENFNETNSVGLKVVLGGTTVHNSRTFIQEVLDFTGS